MVVVNRRDTGSGEWRKRQRDGDHRSFDQHLRSFAAEKTILASRAKRPRRFRAETAARSRRRFHLETAMHGARPFRLLVVSRFSRRSREEKISPALGVVTPTLDFLARLVKTGLHLLTVG
jgi:hypothetical protein